MNVFESSENETSVPIKNSFAIQELLGLEDCSESRRKEPNNHHHHHHSVKSPNSSDFLHMTKGLSFSNSGGQRLYFNPNLISGSLFQSSQFHNIPQLVSLDQSKDVLGSGKCVRRCVSNHERCLCSKVLFHSDVRCFKDKF